LVYDISRWGRFQDVDESAYDEFEANKSIADYLILPAARVTRPYLSFSAWSDRGAVRVDTVEELAIATKMQLSRASARRRLL
jgi:hypothetical protein